MKCDICGKSPTFGSAVSHSKRHTNRSWEPNVHPAKLNVDGKIQRMKVCTRCLRTINKQSRKTASTAS